MKKHRWLLFALIFFHCINGFAQTNPVLITPLPAVLMESSGIEVNATNSIWTHNDSGDYGRIFKIDTLGNLLRTLYLSVDTAMDCEDIAQDDSGNYYIGDFGNNLNDRTDLRIYKIPNPDSVAGDTVMSGIIYFSYPDQQLFPPDSTLINFDCEAMFHFGDSLYIFSKNRGISTFSRMYRLPDQPGNYTALLLDSFNTGNWVTSADISTSGKSMVLFSEMRIWLFTDFTGSDFFGGSAQQIAMDFSQKEGIVFVNDTLVYITDEKLLNLGGNLYKLNLAPWINSVGENAKPQNACRFYPNPAHNTLEILTDRNSPPSEISISNLLGITLLKTMTHGIVDISTLATGMYLITINEGNRHFTGKFVKE
jgi:hypothetical protein